MTKTAKTKDTIKPSTPRSSFKRHEVFRIGTMIQEATEHSLMGRSWREGQSEETIAQRVSIDLGRAVSAEDVRRVRLSTVGKLAGESMPAKEKIAVLSRQIERLVSRIADLERRLEDLEDGATDPAPPPEPNGAVVTRTGNRFHR